MVKRYAVLKDNIVTNIIMLHDKDIFPYIEHTKEIIIDITNEQVIKTHEDDANMITEEAFSPGIGWKYIQTQKVFIDPNNQRFFSVENK